MFASEFSTTRLKAALLFSATLCALGALAYLTPFHNVIDDTLFSRGAYAILPMIPAVVAFFRAYENSALGVRFACFMAGCAMTSMAVANALTSFSIQHSNPAAFPVLNLVLVALVYIPGLTAAFWATGERKRSTDILDGALAASSMVFIVWSILAPILAKHYATSGTVAIAASSALCDATIVTLAALAIRRGTTTATRLGMFSFALAETMDFGHDVIWAATGTGVAVPHQAMFFTICHCAILTVTLFMAGNTPPLDEKQASARYMLLPYLLPVFAGVTAAVSFSQHRNLGSVAFGIGIVVVVALLARQFVAVFDQVKLGKTLEASVDELQAREAELRHLSMHDSLTSLPNRHFLARHIENSTGEKAQFAVLLIDLDNFKAVNDNLGHETGDTLLIHVANTLKLMTREPDVCVRLGGDEFAVLLENTSLATATSVAQRIVDALVINFDTETVSIKVGASLGIAVGDDLAQLEDVMRNADQAMYSRKRADVKGGLAVFN